MSFLKEFKAFAMRGNVVDLAVGVVIGAAFGKIVSSLVSDIIMPIIGVLTAGVDFSKLAIVLKAADGDNAAVLIKYGAFIQTIIDFLIIAICIFVAVNLIQKLRAKEEVPEAPKEEAPKGPTTEELLVQIRDLLKK